MKIVMLDKNYLIDRRIQQACDSLSADGHALHICAMTPPQAIKVADQIAYPMTCFAALRLRQDHFKEKLASRDYDLWMRVVEGRGTRSEMLRAFMLDPHLAAKALPASRFPALIKGPAAALFQFEANRRDRARRRRNRTQMNEQQVLADRYDRLAQFLPREVSPPDDWDLAVADYVSEVLKPDIVQANDLPTLKAAVMIAGAHRCRIVYDAHELYSYQPGIPPAQAKSMFEEERILTKAVWATLVINSDQAEVMARDFGLQRLVPCTNAINPPVGFDPTRRSRLLQDALKLQSGEKVMLFQGGINVGRRIDLLLKGLALASSKHVHMAFLTFSDPEFFARMAAELGIAERVHFLAPVPWYDMLYWCSSADCGVMPYQATDLNTKISSPNKMYEFIQAGTPMIGSSELVNVERVVGRNGFGVLVPLHEPADYAQAIDEMFDESKGGAERFRPAICAAAPEYTWDRAFEPVRSLYRELAGLPSPV